MNILQDIIYDEKLAWKKSLDGKIENLIVKIDEESLMELNQNKDKLQLSNIEDFPNLKNQIIKLKNEFLIRGNGFFIIDGNSFLGFNDEHVKEIYRLISLGLGQLYVQNIKNEKFVVITDEGKSMSTGGRYHQTKEGGSYHTDSPQWSKVPDFVGLLCIRPAKIGGESKFVSAYTIHNEMLKINRENIDAGQKIAEKPLTNEQNSILDEVDRIIHDEKFCVSYDLKKFDMTFFNNHRIIHGRTSFEDYLDEKMKRYMIRTWIKDLN